ncbi:unnamed protein product, partial [Ectocarpus sp. 8 AP-2014]
MFINCQSDGILRRLRGPGETGYKIPEGESNTKLYHYTSGTNYLLYAWA